MTVLDTITRFFPILAPRMKKQQPILISLADFPLSGSQMRLMLKLCGLSMSAFADFIKRSPSYVSATLGRKHSTLPLRSIRQLLDFLGEENFKEAYNQVSSGVVHKALPLKFLKPMLKHCGFSCSDFCASLGKSHSFFLDNTAAFRASLPLPIIDKLKRFLGEQEYDIALQKAISSEQRRQPHKQ